MDQDQDNSHGEPLVNLLSLPTELLVYIISFLSSLRDRVKLRYVSKCLRCVIEGTPSLWKEFVWPYYDSREKCSVKEVLKVCGQHIKVLSFPNSRVPSTLIEILQYCSNVQHLSLPSTWLDPEHLRNTIHHMGCLQTLELTVNIDSDLKQLSLSVAQLRKITMHFYTNNFFTLLKELLKHCMKIESRPSTVNVIGPEKPIKIVQGLLIRYATRLIPIPTGSSTTFRVYNRFDKSPLNFSPTLPYFQLQVEESGQVITPCVKLSNFGILGLNNDVAVITNCQYGGRTMYMVWYQTDDVILNKLNSIHITRCDNLSCVTHFDLANCVSLQSGHLEQLAIACRELQVLNLQKCYDCLKSLQGLQAIASHCLNLQGLNLLGIHVLEVEDHNVILLWEILSDMNLTHLAVELGFLKSEAINKRKLISLYQRCWTIRGIQCDNHDEVVFAEVGLMLSYFSSLNYFFMRYHTSPPTIVQDVINNCKELRCVSFRSNDYNNLLSLNTTRNQNLQQLYIDSSCTCVPDDFMTSVSSHGGLVHVVIRVRSLTPKGITILVRNSPNLMTLFLHIITNCEGRAAFESCSANLKKKFWNRKLFTSGNYKVAAHFGGIGDKLREFGLTDLLSLW